MIKRFVTILKFLLIFLLVAGWIFSGWPRIWESPPIPPEAQEAQAQTEGIILFQDVADATPSGWTCKSCAGGDTTYSDKFLIGTSTSAVGSTGGAATSTHTVTVTVSTYSNDDANKGSTASTVCSSHSHNNTTTITATSTLPTFRGIKVIKRTSGTGIPTNAIGMFDSNPGVGWTVYTSQDGYFVMGSSTATTGGRSTHTHTVTSTLSSPATGTCATKSGTSAGGILAAHCLCSIIRMWGFCSF